MFEPLLIFADIPQSEEEMSVHSMYNNSAFIRKQILTAGVEVQEPIAISSTAVRVAWDVARNTQYITVSNQKKILQKFMEKYTKLLKQK